MVFNYNYVNKAADELGVTLTKYLKDSSSKYVIINKTKDDIVKWDSDKSPVIYTNKEKAKAAFENMKLYVDMSGYEIITEWEFLFKYNSDILLGFIENLA